MSGAVVPGPTSAPAPARSGSAAVSRVVSYARFEAVGMLRNGEQLLVAVVLPALALLALGVAEIVPVTGDRLQVVTPGVLALAIVSSSFTSLAIATGFDRRWGVLRQLATTPLGARGIAAGKVLAVLVVQAVQLVLLSALALALGWRPEVAGLPVAVVAWLLGSVCFSALALVVAGQLRAEAVLALANLLWVAIAAVGGVLLPTTGDSPTAFPPAAWLPSGALGNLMRGALGEGAVPLTAWLVLAAWAVLAGAAALRWFRPSE